MSTQEFAAPYGETVGHSETTLEPGTSLAKERLSAGARARARVIGDRDSVIRRALAVADMLAVGIALAASAVVLGDDSLTGWVLLVPFAFVLVAKAMGLYDRDGHVLHRTTLDEFPALFGIATLGTLLISLSGDALVAGDLGRRQILGTWLLLTVLLVGLRAIARLVAARYTKTERCLLVGDRSTAEILRGQFGMSAHVNAELVGTIPRSSLPYGQRFVNGRNRDLGPMLIDQSIDRVILSVGKDEDEALLYTIRELKQFGVKVSVMPPASRIAGPYAEPDHLHGITLLGMRRFEFTRSSSLIKRTFDVVGSAVALVLLAPVFLVVAIGIRLDSKGPIFFRQDRIGREGEGFEIIKFRSMEAQADMQKPDINHLNEGAAGLFKIRRDPRVTRVGRFLRRWQLDELPQLLNVFKGQMSLVGPRPLIPDEDGLIEGWYRRRLDVPPGMTGHWQILGSSSSIPLSEMVKLDYLYVATWSLWGDVKLLLRTVPFMIRQGGI